jgi:hypothetical protein
VPPGPARSSSERDRPLALVSPTGGGRRAAGIPSDAALLHDLAGYVARRAPQSLRMADRRRVAALLRRGEAAAAVAHYFAQVGQRRPLRAGRENRP